ncbi:MAG: hypothetical protein RLZZ11_1524, partial [Cyanobacteriota bacterium]
MSAIYSISVDVNGSVQTFSCAEDQTVLAAAEAVGVALP